ncbi:MAG TPA: MFS transporter [Candidatus Binatia bacterium]|nr:MFS transporter [Candidatus Binatia bacterium]
MAEVETPISAPATTSTGVPWWRLLNRYHWFVLIVAALGWLFDCLDQQLFTLSRGRAMQALLPKGSNIVQWGTYSTSIFLIGWATGGLFFGMLGDRIGRAKTMMVTILVYSVCTGLSALSQGFWDFAFYRFITGLGVGGEFAVGVALIAEVMPDKARPGALGLLQALSAIGNITAALVGMGMAKLEAQGHIAAGNSWRWMFVIGALPALLAVVVFAKLKEPERWVKLKASGELAKRSAFTYSDLFGSPRWRRNAFIGMLLACTGVIGLWGIGFFTPEFTRSIIAKSLAAKGVPAAQIPAQVDHWASVALFILQIGAFSGMLTFTWIAQRFGRRPALALAFITALLSTANTFLFFRELKDLWMIFVMGFFQLAPFAIYAIYLPELFPTSLRSTGTSFCYNVGRFVAATGPLLLGQLTSKVYYQQPEPLRYAGVTMCAVFLLGLLVIPFAPETRNLPLPEEDRGFAH